MSRGGNNGPLGRMVALPYKWYPLCGPGAMIRIGRKMVALARKTYPENPSDSNCVAFHS
jgi:hypothetical protein